MMHQNATGGAAGDPNVTRAAANNFPPGMNNEYHDFVFWP